MPYRKTYQLTESEWQIWNHLRKQHFQNAQNGLSLEEAYQIVTSPQWEWVPGFFRL